MNLDRILRHAFFDEEVGYLDTLITLELDDLTGLLILNERAVASEFLLECLQELLSIVLLGQALQRREGLASVPLLNADVDVVLLRANVCARAKRVSLVCEGVESVEVLHAHATVGEIRLKTEWGGRLSGGAGSKRERDGERLEAGDAG